MENFISFLTDNWGYITPLILWFAARVVKTDNNYDLVEMILTFIGNYLIPNRRKNKSHKGGYGSNTGKFPIILLLLLPTICSGQLNGNFKSVRFVNAGSNEAAIAQVNGSIYYNEGTNTFRAYQNGVWTDLIGGGGIGTASNGLNLVGSDVRLGGPLTETTTISGTERLTFSVDSIDLISPSGARFFLQSTGDYAFNLSTGIIADFNGAPTGLTYAADYSANFTDRNIPDVGYVNSRVAGIAASSEVQNPQPADDLEAIVWSNFTSEYVLTQVTTSAANGVQIAGGTQVQLGGSLLSNTTVSAENNILEFDAGTAGVTNSGSVEISLTSLSSTYSDITFTNNTSFTQSNTAISMTTNGLTTTSNSSGLSITDTNALLTVQPLAFSMNVISENGDLNLGGDGINVTGRSITAGATATSPINITTGQQTVTGNTGGIALTTGNSTGGSSGNIQLATGDAGTTAGAIEFEFGNTANRIDFTSLSTSFNTLGNYDILNPSGSLTIEPETGLDLITTDDPGAGTSGPITLASGTSVSGNTGSIVIQTGTTSGTRGNITLEGGILIFSGLPTSSAGLPSGAVWNNAGVLNIIP